MVSSETLCPLQESHNIWQSGSAEENKQEDSLNGAHPGVSGEKKDDEKWICRKSLNLRDSLTLLLQLQNTEFTLIWNHFLY